MHIFSKNMFRLGAQLLWPVPVTCGMWPVKETRLLGTKRREWVTGVLTIFCRLLGSIGPLQLGSLDYNWISIFGKSPKTCCSTNLLSFSKNLNRHKMSSFNARSPKLGHCDIFDMLFPFLLFLKFRSIILRKIIHVMRHRAIWLSNKGKWNLKISMTLSVRLSSNRS